MHRSILHLVRVNEFARKNATRSEHHVFGASHPVVAVAVAEDRHGDRRAASRGKGTEALRALGHEVATPLDRCRRMVARNPRHLDQLLQHRHARSGSTCMPADSIQPSSDDMPPEPAPLARRRKRA